jgi:excisionase family DNA binding protein
MDVRRPLKTAEVAEFLGQTPRNVLRMVQNGQIPAKQLGSQ